MKYFWTLAVSVGLICCAMGLEVDTAKYRRPAFFTVTEQVVNEDVEPFTATIGAFGNALVSAAFEPAVFRTRFFAEGDAPDRVVLSASAITGYDVLREGFYDGAEVRVYRVVDGKVRIVRRDRVAQGGSSMSGWVLASGDGKLVPAKSGSDKGQYIYAFDDYNRTGVPYWFTVVSVDKNGVESEKATAVRVERASAKLGRKLDPTERVSFKAAKTVPSGGLPPAKPQALSASYEAAAGAAILKWEATTSDAIAGYRVYRSDYAPETHRNGYYLKLEGGVPKDPEATIRKGDWVIVGKTFASFSRNQYHSNRVWGSHQNKAAMPNGMAFFPDEDSALTWVLEPHSGDTPVTDAGATCAKFSMKEGAKLLFEEYNYGPTEQAWYRVLQPGQKFVVEFWARQEGMTNPTAIFKLNGYYNGKVAPQTFTIGKTWQLFRATFNVDQLYEGKGGIGQTSLGFNGPGTLWLDNYRVYEEAAPFLDYMPQEYADLKASGMKALRTHAFIKSSTHTHDMAQLTNPRGAISGLDKGNTLPQTLGMMEKAGVLPWLQVEMHMTPEEWLGFVEYLAAPYDPAKDKPADKPWAYKRFAQGRRDPWTDAFPRIDFEISNETWNWLFQPWVFESMTDGKTGREYNRAEVYGLFQEHVIDCLKASPYWASSGLDTKVRFILGGWRIQEYGLKAVTTSKRSHVVTRAGYNGGWDEGEGPSEGTDASLFMTTIHPGQSAIPEAVEMKMKRDKMKTEGIADFQIGTYEAGPGYALSGLNNQARMTEAQVRSQEETMKSLAAGTATLDTFLGRAANDYDLQNFFTYYHGRSHWVSHTSLQNNSRPHPSWMTLALFNTKAIGDMLKVVSEGLPVVDLPAFNRRKATLDVPLAACYATRLRDRLCLFVLSRKINKYPIAADDGFTAVTITLPIRGAKSVTLYRMVGDPRSHNLDSEQVRIETRTLPPSVAKPVFVVDDKTGADVRGLPPGATLLYVFEGIAKQ